ncbi:MAG: hypothetical protein E5Y01_09325 [Mesorhizobium sp.]|nr:MAG: hypothetical protein EOR75_13505 [Mesorhizobium sp.]TJV52550.1 MAG: hypothetical protein E5Y01_09325 [Mesorhizobium sp.]
MATARIFCSQENRECRVQKFVIIELFGPPGSGKTTFAHALAKRLCENGYRAEVARSYQPAQRSGTLDFGVFLFVRRIVSATFSTMKLICFPRNGIEDLSKSLLMVRAIPPKKAIWRARIWQHLLKMSCVWDQAKLAEGIVIFDEGYVQAIGSLASLNGAAGKAALATALNNVPVADITVRVVVPRPIVATRLRQRMEREPPAERLFEADFDVNMGSFGVFKKISELLSVSGRDFISVGISSGPTTMKSIQDVERKIVAKLTESGGGSPSGTSARAMDGAN